MWINDGKLDDLTERFFAHPLPPQTSFTDHSADGSIALRGNGNHCDYLVRFSLTTGLSEKEIFDYYAKARIRGIETEPVTVTVYGPMHSSTFGQIGHHNRPVVVELFDSTDAGFDLRCH
ncbi:hypothetical protein [Streptosporangium fragile]